MAYAIYNWIIVSIPILNELSHLNQYEISLSYRPVAYVIFHIIVCHGYLPVFKLVTHNKQFTRKLQILSVIYVTTSGVNPQNIYFKKQITLFPNIRQKIKATKTEATWSSDSKKYS